VDDVTRRVIRIVDNNPRYLRWAAVLCVAFACLCITVLADAYAWPAGILSIPAAMMGAWLFDRARNLIERREELAELTAEYERSNDG
jgi:uncharacterized membrane protein YjjP (DUF1212 family)